MQADLLTRSLQPGARILEIGCGEGLLLGELAHRGFRVTGVEPSTTASEIARQNGLQVLTGYFPQIKPPGLFDTVIMSHVLEHLPQPLEILRAVQSIAPAGRVLFVQTNWKGLVPRVYRRRWYAWVPAEHYWHFTPGGLSRIFQPFDWRTIALEYSSLIHNENIVTYLASLIPAWLDQFHLLTALPA
jgi:2-polyprenyl-3-methyl-5-hydroxy-6-metoxy-1,4-benzoquinol methylase